MTSDRLYCALLSLYPVRFRVRFGTEMAQLFRDCCREEPTLAALWLRTLKDLVLSLTREWCREMSLPDSEIDYPGLADCFMISMVVGTLLLGWGSAALVALNLRPLLNFIAGGIVTCALAAVIGIVFARIVARYTRTEHQRSIKA
jgi:hypothetical protein